VVNIHATDAVPVRIRLYGETGTCTAVARLRFPDRDIRAHNTHDAPANVALEHVARVPAGEMHELPAASVTRLTFDFVY
jgi:alpha-L-arabinofuranosidase